MRGAILLPIAALFCGLVRESEGMTCTHLTSWTCQKTEYMTGKCVQGVCQCVSSDYTPGPYGCQKKVKSELKSENTDSGNLQTGAQIFLQCTKSISGTCRWFKDGRELDHKDDYWEMENVTPDMSGAYTCLSNPAGLSSEESDPFYLNVADTFPNKLKVSDMPRRMVVGTMIDFNCMTEVTYASQTFQWVLDGVAVPGESSYSYVYRHTVTPGDAGKTLRCTLPNAEDSDSVTFPDSFETDIAGVEIHPQGPTSILVGTSLVMECRLTGGFPKPSFWDDLIQFEWRQDGQVVESQPYQSMRTYADWLDVASFTCQAKAGNNPPKVSSPVIVTGKHSMLSKPLISLSYGHLKNGYDCLTCVYETVNTSQPVRYSWYKGYTELRGFTDKTLQMNEASDWYYSGMYSCHVTGDDGSVESNQYIWLANASSVSYDLLTFKAPAHLGVGTPLTLTCDPSLFNTPGRVYTWTVDNVIQAGQTSSTLVYTPTSGDKVVIKCKYTFGGVTSQETVAAIQPKYIFSVTVKVNDLNMTSFQPVSGTKVKCTCDVIKSAGVGPVTYHWKKGSTVVSGETSQEFQVVMGTAGSSPIRISCLATTDSVTVSSRAITLSPQTDAEMPRVFIESEDDFKREGPVVMRCLSTSQAEGATFVWVKDGTVIKGVDSYDYTIREVSQRDDGNYTCTITVGGQTSKASNVTTLLTLPNERTCTWASQCLEPNMDSTLCLKGQCRCLAGFAMKGGKCLSPQRPQGEELISAPPSGHLRSLIFKPDVPSRARPAAVMMGPL